MHRLLRNFIDDTFRDLRLITGLSLFSLSVFSVAVVMGSALGVSPVTFTRDPLASLRAPAHLGFISQLGIFVWTFGSAFCFCGAFSLSGGFRANRPKQFYLASGHGGLFLGIDDTFQFHEHVWPTYFGLPELYFYGLLAAAGLAFLIYFREIVFHQNIALLGLALVSFLASIIIDIMLEQRNVTVFLEDTLKFSGSVFLAGFFASRVVRDLRAAV